MSNKLYLLPGTISTTVVDSSGLTVQNLSLLGGYINTSGATWVGTTSSSGLQLNNANLLSPTISGAFMYGGTISGFIINNSSISGGTINGVTMGGVTISGAVINSSSISGGSLTGAAVSGGSISGAVINGSSISGGSLTGAAVSGGSISGAAINGGSISGATFYDVTISGPFETLSVSGVTTISGTLGVGTTTIASGSKFDVITNSTTSVGMSNFRAPNLTTSNIVAINIGRNQSTRNEMSLVYGYNGNNSNSNYAMFQWNNVPTPPLYLQADNTVGINTSSTVETLTVGGGVQVANNIVGNVSSTAFSLSANPTATVNQGGFVSVYGSTNGTLSGAVVLGSNSAANLCCRNGLVGVGTTTPSLTLDVSGDIRTNTNLRVSAASTLPCAHFNNSTNFTQIQFGSTSNYGGYLTSLLDAQAILTAGSYGNNNNWTSTTNGGASYFELTGSTFRFLNAPTTTLNTTTTWGEVARINSSGYFGLGIAAPIYQLQLSLDSAAKPTTNTWTIASDQRIKTNVVDADLSICYSILKNLKLKYFEWDSHYVKSDDKHSVGYIAQDVQKYFPNAVLVKAATFTVSGTSGESVQETIEDFHYLNTDQIIKAAYGALQKVMQDKEKIEVELNEQNDHSQKLSTIVAEQSDEIDRHLETINAQGQELIQLKSQMADVLSRLAALEAK
jgi:gas vesicle protein